MDLDKISRSASMDAEIGNQLDSDVGKVLRNTYMLLGASIAFSAVMAGISMLLRVPYMGLWMLLPYFALLFMIEKNKILNTFHIALLVFISVILLYLISAGFINDFKNAKNPWNGEYCFICKIESFVNRENNNVSIVAKRDN